MSREEERRSRASLPKSAKVTPSESTINLSDILALLMRRIPVLLLAALAAAGASAAYYLLTPPTYESRAEIFVERKDSSLATKGVDGNSVSQTRVTEDVLATQMELVQSRRVIDTALREKGLDKLESITSKLQLDQTPTDYVLKRLFITRGGSGQAKTANVLNVAFRHSNAVESRDVVEAVIGSYRNFLNESFKDVNLEAATAIRQAQVELQTELESAERAFQDFRRDAPSVMWKGGEETTNIHRIRYEGIQQELSQIRLTAAEVRGRLEMVERAVSDRGEEGLSDLERLSLIDEKNLTRVGLLVQVDRSESESPEFQSRQPARMQQAQTEYQNLLTATLKQQTLLQDLGEGHPEVKSTRQSIETIRKFIDSQSAGLATSGKDGNMLDPKNLFSAYTKLLRNDLLAFVNREKELELLATKEEEKARELVQFELQGEALKKSVQRRTQLFDLTMDRLREISLASDTGGFKNEVVEEPREGTIVAPTKTLAAALGLAVFLAIAASGIGVAEFRDRRFHSTEAVLNTLQVPLLGRIPSLSPETLKEAGSKRPAEISGFSATLCSVTAPKSREAESFRSLRATLMFSDSIDKVKVLSLTSPRPGDGKSTVAANLAIGLAQAGKNVLLVDCDLRRPNIHKLFGLKNELGVNEYITGGASLVTILRKMPVEGLSLITSGAIPPNPAELFSSVKFKDFLEEVRPLYDLVILDCPPVTVVSDPAIVAAQADASVLVVRIDNDSVPVTEQAKDIFDRLNIELTGVVINAVPASSHFDYGANYYRYGYEYSDDYADYVSGRSKT